MMVLFLVPLLLTLNKTATWAGGLVSRPGDHRWEIHLSGPESPHSEKKDRINSSQLNCALSFLSQKNTFCVIPFTWLSKRAHWLVSFRNASIGGQTTKEPKKWWSQKPRIRWWLCLVGLGGQRGFGELRIFYFLIWVVDTGAFPLYLLVSLYICALLIYFYLTFYFGTFIFQHLQSRYNSIINLNFNNYPHFSIFVAHRHAS